MTVVRDVRALEPADDVSAERFRLGFRRLASTVSVVTYRDLDGVIRGMTATSFCALSAKPPSLLVSIERTTRTHAHLEGVQTFGLDLLAADQREVARFCARPGVEKVLPATWLMPVASDAAPRLAGSVAHFDCRIERIEAAFTHSIVIALIVSVALPTEDADPLIYRDGRFRALLTDD